MRGQTCWSAPSRILGQLGSNENGFRGDAQDCAHACQGAWKDADRWLSGQKQQTVNLPTPVVYGGSNPPLSTRKAVASGQWLVASALWPVDGMSLLATNH